MAFELPEHQTQLDAMVAWAMSHESPELRADAAGTLAKAMYATWRELSTVRRAAIRELASMGFTYAELAEMFGVSKARVEQILNY